MKIDRQAKAFLSFAIWVSLFLIAVFLPKYFPVASIPVLGSVLLWLLKLAYEHFDSINLFVNRSLLWVFNREVAWEMKAHFIGDYGQSEIDDIQKRIATKYPSLQIIQSGDEEETLSLPNLGIVIKISIVEYPSDVDNFSTEMLFSFARVVVPFRHSTRVLNAITELIQDTLRNVLQPKEEKYEFKALFATQNPYLGLFVKRLRITNESPRLHVEFGDREGVNQGKVAVLIDRVSLTTKDISSLQALSKKYITLSSLNLSET